MKPYKLFLIDPQVAFTKEGEPLCVPGAPQDATRIATLIANTTAVLADIVMTIDTHPEDHIGHPGYWVTNDGASPAPFTFITPDMIQSGAILAADASKREYAREYINALGGAMVWPVHCVPGTESHKVNLEIASAINNWANSAGRGEPTVVKKGFDLDLESFGIFAPEFTASENKLAVFNDNLVADLLFGDLPIVIAGEALSHCVKRSVEQLVKRIKDLGIAFDFGRIILLKDCMSSVPSFEAVGEQFLSDMEAVGCRVVTVGDLLADRVI